MMTAGWITFVLRFVLACALSASAYVSAAADRTLAAPAAEESVSAPTGQAPKAALRSLPHEGALPFDSKAARNLNSRRVAAPAQHPGDKAASPSGETAQAVRIVVGLTALAILPALLICLTAFLRVIIVLSMLRHAIGMPETPPNTVLLGLALFLTLFTMAPVFHQLNQDALQPFMAGQLGVEGAYQKGSGPLREFMVRQTREQDLALMVELSKAKRPEGMADISNAQLIPAFMLSELRAAFQIGFVIFLPFLLIDLIVSSVLMALGMMMMPPTTVALPLKILMFILVDGWTVVLKGLMGSFH